MEALFPCGVPHNRRSFHTSFPVACHQSLLPSLSGKQSFQYPATLGCVHCLCYHRASPKQTVFTAGGLFTMSKSKGQGGRAVLSRGGVGGAWCRSFPSFDDCLSHIPFPLATPFFNKKYTSKNRNLRAGWALTGTNRLTYDRGNRADSVWFLGAQHPLQRPIPAPCRGQASSPGIRVQDGTTRQRVSKIRHRKESGRRVIQKTEWVNPKTKRIGDALDSYL